MTDDIKKQISDRYFKEYLQQIEKGPGIGGKLVRSLKTKELMIPCLVALTSVAIAVPPLAMAAGVFSGAFLYGSVAMGAVGLATSLAQLASVSKTRQDINLLAQKSINQDIDNGKLINRYKNDLIADQRQKLSTVSQSLSVLEQVSKLEDFDKVAVRPSETLKDSPAKPSASPKINCLK